MGLNVCECGGKAESPPGRRVSSHSCLAKVQGVVTYISPVEAFATAIKFFDRQKVCLIA